MYFDIDLSVLLHQNMGFMKTSLLRKYFFYMITGPADRRGARVCDHSALLRVPRTGASSRHEHSSFLLLHSPSSLLFHLYWESILWTMFLNMEKIYWMLVLHIIFSVILLKRNTHILNIPQQKLFFFLKT